MKYWVLKLNSGDDGVFLSSLPENGPKDYEYSKGKSLVARHPEAQESAMYYDPDRAEAIVLKDFVENLSDVIVCNHNVRSVLDGLEIKNVEYLPVWLMDHKNAVSSKDYMIANVLGSLDVIDMENSDYEMGVIIEDQIDDIDELVVDYDSMPEDARIFRASKKLDLVFIRDDVKQAFEKAGLQGYLAHEADGWDGLD